MSLRDTLTFIGCSTDDAGRYVDPQRFALGGASTRLTSQVWHLPTPNSVLAQLQSESLQKLRLPDLKRAIAVAVSTHPPQKRTWLIRINLCAPAAKLVASIPMPCG